MLEPLQEAARATRWVYLKPRAVQGLRRIRGKVSLPFVKSFSIGQSFLSSLVHLETQH